MAEDDRRRHFEIEQLLARYAHCLDDDRLEEWPKFFAETCTYKITSAENQRCNLPVGLFFANTRGMLEDRVSALREANIYEPQRYRHFIAQIVILECDDAVARVQSSFQIVRIMQDGRTMLFATGCYLDRIAIGAAPFLFEERIVVCDSDRIDTLLAIPF
ncbi:MAG: terephthalate 1,2-dioxygenase [Rhodospirillales bacterium]|jgi:anthranilate 1,2-dioxygenase small subunit|nr:terephthalate 1,2-dioxygenase [Rhodospirillales bacterium]